MTGEGICFLVLSYWGQAFKCSGVVTPMLEVPKTASPDLYFISNPSNLEDEYCSEDPVESAI